MSIYINRLIRSSSGASLTCSCLVHRRFYAERKSSATHYEALGVNSNASTKEIKSAFYKLSKKHHPDVNPEDSNAATKFSIISNAYDILGDPVKRRDYDNELLSRTSSSDPYVTYNRTSTYAQRARAHRPSTWKPPPSSGGFQGADNAFGSSRSTSHGTFDREQYDTAFGRYRGPLPKGRSNAYDYDEFYRAHYNDFQNWTTSRKQAQEKLRREREEEAAKRDRSMASKLSLAALWVSFGLLLFFTAALLHDMNFEKPADQYQASFYIMKKPTKTKSPPESTAKS